MHPLAAAAPETKAQTIESLLSSPELPTPDRPWEACGMGPQTPLVAQTQVEFFAGVALP